MTDDNPVSKWRAAGQQHLAAPDRTRSDKGGPPMSSDNPATTTTRTICKYPGCDQPAATATGPGRPPEYCEGRGHTKVTAWRERRRLAAAAAGTPTAAATDKPVTMARPTGAELPRSLRAAADRGAGIAGPARDARPTLSDPT